MSQFWTVLLTSGTVGTVLTALFGYLQWRMKQKADTQTKSVDIQEQMRKELWDEINNLRKALKEATVTFMDLQSQFLRNLTIQQENVEQLRKFGALLNLALTCLDRVEDVERHIFSENDLVEARTVLGEMKREAATLRARALNASQGA